MFHDESWKPIYFGGVKRSKSMSRVTAWLFALFWVLVSSSCYCRCSFAVNCHQIVKCLIVTGVYGCMADTKIQNLVKFADCRGVQTINSPKGNSSEYFSPKTNHRTTIHRADHLPAGLFTAENFTRGLFTGNWLITYPYVCALTKAGVNTWSGQSRVI